MKLYFAVRNGALAALAALALFACVSPARANLVANGNFTGTTLNSPGGYVCPSADSCVSTVTDWSATCSASGCDFSQTPTSLLFYGTGGTAWNGSPSDSFGGFYTPSTDLAGYSGNYIADDGDSHYSGSIYQTINGLTVGQNYVLTFDEAGAEQSGGCCAPNFESWQVSLGAESQTSTVLNNAAGGFTGWTAQSMTFSATGTSEVLNFLSVGGPTGAPPVALLADVSLTQATPEPAYFVLLGGGLALMLAWRVRVMRRS